LENFLDSVNPEKSQASCHTALKSDANQAKVVNYVQSDCDSGFVCTVFTRKSSSVMTVQFGQKSAIPEEACSDLFFSHYGTKTVLLVSGSAQAAETCALSGRYYLTPLSSETLELTDCHAPTSLHLVAECGASALSVEWECPGRNLSRMRYSCMSSWSSRGRTHLVLSREDSVTKLCLTLADRVLSVSEHNCAGVQPHYNISETGPCLQALSSPPSDSAQQIQCHNLLLLIAAFVLVQNTLFSS